MNLISRNISFKRLIIGKEYEENTLYITNYHLSQVVVTFIIYMKKYTITPISVTDSKQLGLKNIFDKSSPVKNNFISYQYNFFS